jgi:hypothetical protein
MMKAKRETVREEMIARLRRNREGRLLPEQWSTMTIEPLVTLLLLSSPLILVIGIRLPLLLSRGGLVLAVVAIGIALMLLLRARRYARIKLRSHLLYAAEQPLVRRLLGQSTIFYDDEGKVYKFGRWLCPHVPLIPNHAYRTYYLEDAEQMVLCSLISQEDPEAKDFQPSATFRGHIGGSARASA